ncbi:MAG TPA: SDR family oxidoreductase [Clostridiaceae bacterium]|nr:SDR family oxidoreductase [Clostridiaceae bacterium]
MKYFSEKFLSGRTALVTGAAMKLGASIAVELANYGANVIVNYKKLKKEADSVVNIIKSLSQKAMAIQGDVSNEDDVIRIISTTVKEFGSIDILINNAGPWTNSYLKELDSAEWDWIMNSNLKSAFMASKHSAKYMRQKGWGRIINISAGSSFVRNHSVYGLAKNALNVLTESLALELSPKITVNGIAPGMIDVPDVQDDEKVRAIKDTPLRRLVTLKEVASMVVVMCSPLFDTITGHVVTMDGGRTIPREILV